MARTDSFRTQHKGIATVVEALSAKLNPAGVAADSAAIRTLISQLMGKLTVHLAMEDKVLYPEMLLAKDANVVATTKKYMGEMGGIAATARKYSETYSSAQVLAANSAAFISDTKGLISALSARMQREESELYSMADKM